MKPKTKWITLAVALVGLVVGYALLLWQGPWWLDGAHLREKDLQPADGVVITGFRTALGALGLGVLGLAGLVYTHRTLEHTRTKDREQAELTRDGQVTDRYVEAIKLLSDKEATSRIGGIYALERIMRDSKKDGDTIVQVLAAFVRKEAAKGADDESQYRPKEEVQAAMTVIGRRWSRGIDPLNLAGVQLRLVDLQHADLTDTCMDFANLAAANLEAANLSNVSLHKADLSAAAMTDASLYNAKLTAARLDKTTLTHAILEDADLRGADLSQARGLDVEELCKARLNTETKLPADLQADERVKARIAECALSV
ncbi:pentapeptide repeat-containing protein [Streptomyces sp. 4N124]|uniref:pentapeptide repeat-containing protein n=1 Tax=Streptomyces sp. 4N124 TaxID=3457420 RepID=UPI003FD68C1A